MKRRDSRIIKPIFIAVTIFLILTLKDLLTEMVGGKIGDYLKDNFGITTTALVYCLIAVLAVALIYAIYEAFKQTTEKDENQILTENIEPDVKKLYDSLKERYQKRYESKLDERFEIKLEVSEDWDESKTQTFKERYDKDAKISEAFPRLKELFETKDGLLIVGEPGAGKTVLLLKVALNLLDKTNLKEKEPFPVIFNLASWNEDYKDFGEWLKAMLVSGNGLSKDFAERLLREKRFILLLDGLDELARNETKAEADQKRAACLESLNNYLDGEKTVICCRIDEFAAMQKNTAQDAPVSAKVEVLNLTEAELLNALEHAQNHADTKHHASAKNLSDLIVKDENAALRKILCTPFYFTIALEVFYKRLPAETNLPQNEEELGTYLIEKYVERKLEKTPNPNNFDKGKTKKWLKWLGQMTQRKNIINVELANLQSKDLKSKWLYVITFCTILSISFYTLGSWASLLYIILGSIILIKKLKISEKSTRKIIFSNREGLIGKIIKYGSISIFLMSAFTLLIGFGINLIFFYEDIFSFIFGLFWMFIIVFALFLPIVLSNSLIVGLWGALIENTQFNTQDIIKINISKLLNWKTWREIFSLFFIYSGICTVWILIIGFLINIIRNSLGSILNYIKMENVNVTFERAVENNFNIKFEYISFFILLGLIFSFIMAVKNSCVSVSKFAYLNNAYQRIKSGIGFSIFEWILLNELLQLSLVFHTFYFEVYNEINKDSSLETADSFVLIFILAVFLIVAILWGAISGLFAGFVYTPFFNHLLLRSFLFLEGSMPLKYATFLNYAAEARILEKDGGQWRFRHQNLQEYFADLMVNDK